MFTLVIASEASVYSTCEKSLYLLPSCVVRCKYIVFLSPQILHTLNCMCGSTWLFYYYTRLECRVKKRVCSIVCVYGLFVCVRVCLIEYVKWWCCCCCCSQYADWRHRQISLYVKCFSWQYVAEDCVRNEIRQRTMKITGWIIIERTREICRIESLITWLSFPLTVWLCLSVEVCRWPKRWRSNTNTLNTLRFDTNWHLPNRTHDFIITKYIVYEAYVALTPM